MLKKSLIFLVILIYGNGFTQPAIDWIHNYDIGGEDSFADIYVIPNDGYALCGSTYPHGGNARNGNEMWVARVDENGDLTWSSTFGVANSNDYLASIIQTDQGEFFAGGRLQDDVAGLLVDADGAQIWLNTYGGNFCNAVLELKSGEFMMAGCAHPHGYLGCINHGGDLLWEGFYGEGSTRFTCIRETEGGIIAAGHSYFDDQPIWRVFVVKVNFEGDVIWSHYLTPEEINQVYCIVSYPDGFALAAQFWNVSTRDFGLITINGEGDMNWYHRYEVGGRQQEFCQSIVRLNQGDFMLTGCISDPTSTPFIMRTAPDGSPRWMAEYELHTIEGYQRFNHTLYSVAETDDGSIIAAGNATVSIDNQGRNGLIMRLVPEILEPQFISWTPEDTVLTVLVGETVDFSVEVHDPLGNELEYNWLLNDERIGGGPEVTVVFDSLGVFEVVCQASNGEFAAEISWNITVSEFFIRSYSPDSTNFSLRRNSEIDFMIEVAAVEGPDLDYSWSFTDRNLRRQNIEGEDSVRVEFNMTGDHRVAAQVRRGNTEDNVVWSIDVHSIIWYWWPHELEMIAPQDTIINFAIFPFNPESDSLECLWTLNGEELDHGVDIDIEMTQTGMQEIVAYVTEDQEADTVMWAVDVSEGAGFTDNDNDAALPADAIMHPPCPNPFNSIVRLDVYLPHSQRIGLNIYDVNGSNVMTLSDEVLPTGRHSFSWDGLNCPAGLYFVTMTGDRREVAQKIVLLK